MIPFSRVNSRWVGVLPYAFLDGEGEVHFDRERQWWGERTDGVAETVRFARLHDLKVMLKPHLWARGGLWVGDYLPESEAEWLRWEQAYSRYILTFARLAETLEVELFVVGTELDATVAPREAYWRDLIQEVRSIYSGEVTYSANWDGFREVPFWDALDYVGVNAYFPLSHAAQPTLEALERAWQPRVRELEALCRRYGIPVFFPEYGYRSIDVPAGNQWELPPERDRTVPANLEAQVLAYEALFRSIWREPWFAGGFLWKWFPDDASRAADLRADYTPQHKPVEEVIRAWYGGEPRVQAGSAPRPIR
ncbi:MAG: hypothetical protein WEA09_03640 [Gemmatimonadota bacterium]